MVNLGDCRHGGFAAATSDALLNSNAGWQAFNGVHVGLFHLINELPGIRRHAVQEAALALREENIESEGGFARSTQAGDHHHAIARDVH